MFADCRLVIPDVNKKMMSFRGASITWSQLTALVCQPTKKVNNTEELTFFSTNIGAPLRPYL
jgi:hypothetical protein